MPSAGMEWQQVEEFSAADEVFENPALKAGFKMAIENGCAVVAKE
jgi:hypothetical protein